MRVYTTAPEAYDYYYMRDTGETVHSELGQTFRVLETDDEPRAVNFQIPRYWSGLHPAVVEGSVEAERFGLR